MVLYDSVTLPLINWSAKIFSYSKWYNEKNPDYLLKKSWAYDSDILNVFLRINTLDVPAYFLKVWVHVNLIHLLGIFLDIN